MARQSRQLADWSPLAVTQSCVHGQDPMACRLRALEQALHLHAQLCAKLQMQVPTLGEAIALSSHQVSAGMLEGAREIATAGNRARHLDLVELGIGLKQAAEDAIAARLPATPEGRGHAPVSLTPPRLPRTLGAEEAPEQHTEQLPRDAAGQWYTPPKHHFDVECADAWMNCVGKQQYAELSGRVLLHDALDPPQFGQ